MQRRSQSARSGAEKRQGMTRRAIFSLALLAVLPPLGILLIWRRRIFQARGRVLLTALAALLMSAEFLLLMPADSVQSVAPQPGKSQARTAIPPDDALTALSNMDELLAGVENTSVGNTDLTDSGMTVEEIQAMTTPEPTGDALLQTVVYCVNSGAKYYHKLEECRGQVNSRALTIEEALNEGLTACGRCNPPSP